MYNWFISNVSIPFKFPFKHSAKERNETESVFIKVDNGKGLKGFGESCPRFYVTQENRYSSVNSIAQFLKGRKIPESIKEIIHWRSEFYKRFPRQYAAWCAIELASLDFLAKQNRTNIFKFLKCGYIQVPRYSAIIGIDSLPNFLWKALRYRLYGMQQLKIKVSGDASFDCRRLKASKLLGFSKDHIRVDMNNCFLNEQRAINYIQQLSDYFWAVEEPLASKNIEELIDISHQINKPIVLDETINPDNIIKILEVLAGEKIMLNLRVSRLGGLLSSIQIARECTKRGVPYLIGSHVGETSLLNRASLVLCGENIGQAVAIEGGFSERFLEFDPAVPKLAFGYRGSIRNMKEVGSSLGISTLKFLNWDPI